MKVKLSLQYPFAQLSLGNGLVISKDDESWMEIDETKEVQEAINEGYLEYEGKLESKSDAKEESKEKSDKGEIWVFAETNNGKIARVVLELLGKGQELANTLNVKLAAILLTNEDKYSKELISYGADKVYVMENPLLKNYDTELFAKVITDAIKKYAPQIIIYGATHIGRDLAPRIARRVETGLTADCTELDITEKGELLQTRPAFGGNLMAQILCKKKPQMSTIRPGVMSITDENKERKGEMINLSTNITTADTRTKLKEAVKSAKKIINLEEAEIIVSGGRGIGSKDNFNNLILPLAKALNAEIGASRGAVDAGWIDKPHQVGQTGKTVKPKVYIACGISGAIQHRAGMQHSDLIIAINKDPAAPIFKVADYGFIADITKFIPALLEELQ